MKNKTPLKCRPFSGAFLMVFLSLITTSGMAKSGGASKPSVSVYTTSFSQVGPLGENVLVSQPEMRFSKGAKADQNSQSLPEISVNPKISYHQIAGYGANLTEASVITINMLAPERRAELMRQLFDPKFSNLTLLRVPLGASDFVDREQGFYTYDDPPEGKADPLLKYFSIERDRKSIELLKEARKLNPNLKIMLSPWSAPTWMKKGSDSYIGGTLDEKHYDAFARYIAKAIETYEAEGIPVSFVSVVNEPYFDDNIWYISMPMNTETQREFISKHLGPELHRRKLKAKILAIDHNFEHHGEALKILGSETARKQIGGVAVHCYGGWAHQTLVVREFYPKVPIYQTECTSLIDGHKFKKDFGAWLDALVLRPYLSASLGWNLALPENGKRPKGLEMCDECTGFVLVDPETKSYRLTTELLSMRHVSRFIEPGAVPLATSLSKETSIHYMLIRNPKSGFVFAATNRSEKPQTFRIRQHASGNRKGLDDVLDYELAPQTAVTLTWK